MYVMWVYVRARTIKSTSICAHQATNLDVVTHVYIWSAQNMKNCVNYLPNVIELTFDHSFDEPDDSIVTALNRIFL